jgi:16S rRNA processing protein RimM
MGETPSERGQERARLPESFLAVGRVVRPHGVRGELLVEGSPELMASVVPERALFVGPEHSRVEVVSVRPHKGRFLLRIQHINSRGDAEDLRGNQLFIRSSDAKELDAGAYYHWQILGLDVVTDEGERLGSVARIVETGANDVYVVRSAQGKDLLIPAIDSVIESVDLESGILTVTLIPGLREVQQ